MIDDDRVVADESAFHFDVRSRLQQQRGLVLKANGEWPACDERDREQIAVVPEDTVAQFQLGLVDATDEVVDRAGEREADAGLGARLDLSHRADAVAGQEEDIGTYSCDGPVRGAADVPADDGDDPVGGILSRIGVHAPDGAFLEDEQLVPEPRVEATDGVAVAANADGSERIPRFTVEDVREEECVRRVGGIG